MMQIPRLFEDITPKLTTERAMELIHAIENEHGIRLVWHCSTTLGLYFIPVFI
jgi:hypothetical protein